MKKNLVFPLLILGSSLATLMGCASDNRLRLTYGSVIDTEASELTYDDFIYRMESGENMIVVTYDSIYSIDCSCWTGFKKIIDEYVNKTTTIVYQIDRNQFSEAGRLVAKEYGLDLPLEKSDPTCIITNNGKITNQYRAYSQNNKPIFESLDGFKKAIEKVTKPAQLIYADRNYLHKQIFEDKVDKFIVYQGRNSCPDCNYCTPNCLVPFSNSHNFKNPVYLMDLQVKGIYYDENMNKDNDTYLAYKQEYQMTEDKNAKFGFSTGVVPTFQVWKKGVLSDACVYFNDVAKKDENGKWVIDETYYTEERIQNLAYTNTILKGLEIEEDKLDVYGEKGFWKKEAAAIYHNKILESFLNYYAVK